jgi:hypothetical protein
MDPEARQRIEKNLFYAARAAVKPWDEFKWHMSGGIFDTGQQNSSQALAIDFFGTLKAAAAVERDAILRQVSARMHLSEFGPWWVELEWEETDFGNAENPKSMRSRWTNVRQSCLNVSLVNAMVGCVPNRNAEVSQ